MPSAFFPEAQFHGHHHHHQYHRHHHHHHHHHHNHCSALVLTAPWTAVQRVEKASQVTDFGEQVAIIIVIITRPRVDHRVIIQLRWLQLLMCSQHFASRFWRSSRKLVEACGHQTVSIALMGFNLDVFWRVQIQLTFLRKCSFFVTHMRSQLTFLRC